MVCLLVNTAAYCSNTCVGLAKTVKKVIDPSFTEKVDYTAEQELFDGCVRVCNHRIYPTLSLSRACMLVFVPSLFVAFDAKAQTLALSDFYHFCSVVAKALQSLVTGLESKIDPALQRCCAFSQISLFRRTMTDSSSCAYF